MYKLSIIVIATSCGIIYSIKIVFIVTTIVFPNISRQGNKTIRTIAIWNFGTVLKTRTAAPIDCTNIFEYPSYSSSAVAVLLTLAGTNVFSSNCVVSFLRFFLILRQKNVLLRFGLLSDLYLKFLPSQFAQ